MISKNQRHLPDVFVAVRIVVVEGVVGVVVVVWISVDGVIVVLRGAAVGGVVGFLVGVVVVVAVVIVGTVEMSNLI